MVLSVGFILSTTPEGRKKVDALPNINSGTSCKPLIYSLYCNINYNPIMEQSNHPVVKTTEANLAEANEAIKAIEESNTGDSGILDSLLVVFTHD